MTGRDGQWLSDSKGCSEGPCFRNSGRCWLMSRVPRPWRQMVAVGTYISGKCGSVGQLFCSPSKPRVWLLISAARCPDFQLCSPQPFHLTWVHAAMGCLWLGGAAAPQGRIVWVLDVGGLSQLGRQYEPEVWLGCLVPQAGSAAPLRSEGALLGCHQRVTSKGC